MSRHLACLLKKSCNCNSWSDEVTMSHLHNDTRDRAACSSCDSSKRATNVPPTGSDRAESRAIGGRSPLASLTNRLPQPPSAAAAAAHFRGFAQGSVRCGDDDGVTTRSRVASGEALGAGGGSSLLTKRASSHGVVTTNHKRRKRGKERAGLERLHVQLPTGGVIPVCDTPTRWRDDSTADADASVADASVADASVADASVADAAAGCGARSPPTQERSQQFFCTCERHRATSPAHVPEESDTMIGDYTVPCCLPLLKNLHGEMHHISPATAADLLRGQFDGAIESFHIVDCRYPYEYVGGHIQGAENVRTEEQLTLRFMKEPLNPQTHCRLWRADDKRRHVIVFYCEFSSHRAPKMWKLLRRLDRERNMSSYPGLCYPEMYVIKGGYKAFFNQFPELCDPRDYKPMRGPEYYSSKEVDGAAGKRLNRGRTRTRLAKQDNSPATTLHFYDDDDL